MTYEEKRRWLSRYGDAMVKAKHLRDDLDEAEKYFIEGMHLLCILIYLINVKKIWYKFEKIVN